ncbi:glutathione S-transferase family protein [Aquisediminimonas profunda]|uniref:glutathione S-transferase family protein n=1 Tax=Aquisediminimonas profunda TaxID=1550733 RepID=UPI001C63B306|nr:glutathione S-transferase family protein [Aquisediminimonas profunda]
MPEVVLHHYDNSPFSEKVRICLGIKGLSWRAVDQPVIMPKPDLVPLTGGYRRIPVMQIGADIYCDSQLIVRELERRFPERPLFPSGSEGLAIAIEQWCDKALFQTAVLAIFGSIGDSVDPAFIKDREALSGQPFNVAAMKAIAPFAVSQIKAHASLLVQQLTDGRDFFAGTDPCLADAAAYYNFWFARTFAPGLVDRFDDLNGFDAWYDRVTAIGHGTPTSLKPAEALEIATNALPEAMNTLPSDAAIRDKNVCLAATDYGRDPIIGTFVGSTQYSLTVARNVPELGEVNVHVSRLGYSVSPA